MEAILVIGNINADWVVRLDEAVRPGLETTGENLGLRPGGAAANAASALAVAGNRVRLAGFIGSDDTGDRLLSLLAAEDRGWDLSGIVRLPGATPACLIVVDPDGERVIVGLYRERAAAQWPEIPAEGVACAYVASRWPAPADLVARLNAAAVPIVSQWRPGYTVRSAAVLVASKDELPPQHRADPWRAARDEGLAPDWLVVTEGARGAWAADGRERLFCPAVPVAVVDATGAGDAFAGGLVHGVARRWPMEACLALACDWGARAVAHDGSTFPKGGDDIGRRPDTARVTRGRYVV
ncbi:MAG TPA: PfkB family carbohydrate kinase [Kiloniellaceae bacterium]|nr:PfkB family carbohydrate kinase [Kiloniellaceae bacterium]